MEPARHTRVLVVANRTAATPRLLAAVRKRADAGPCRFTLLIPDVTDRKRVDWTFESALPALRRAAKGEVGRLTGGPEPLASIQEAVRGGGFDEIMISTLPPRVSKWLRRDLVTQVERLGLPLTAIIPAKGKLTREDQLFLAGSGAGGVGIP